MTGTFELVPLEENIFMSKYALVDVDWHVPMESVGDVSVIKGFGSYYIQEEFAVHHRLSLELNIDQDPLTHFDSGLVVGGFDYPRIDIGVSVNGIECYDTVLNIVAEPEDSRRCGGIVGIPCEAPEEFCKLPEGHCCCDFLGFCTPMPTVCIEIWAPVCGCDGVTYGNECEADAAGISIDFRGECNAICEPDFEPDGDVDGTDASTFKRYYGRSQLNDPCNDINPCNGDFDCDEDVDGSDASVFKDDFGRSLLKNPCPISAAGILCSYY
jgi:hypothetical protein